MPRSKNVVWQPGLTDADKELTKRIAESFEVPPALNSIVQAALKFYAKEKGVEA